MYVCQSWTAPRVLTFLFFLQLDVFVDLNGERMWDGSPMCPEIETCVAVCRVLYVLSPDDLAGAEWVCAQYAVEQRFFVLCFAGILNVDPPLQERLQLVNNELAALDVRLKVRFLKWLCACKLLSQLDL
jgi:hypothetical protein